jgi:hypothetical protein
MRPAGAYTCAPTVARGAVVRLERRQRDAGLLFHPPRVAGSPAARRSRRRAHRHQRLEHGVQFVEPPATLQAAPHDVRKLSGAGSVLIRRIEPPPARDADDTARGIDGTEAKAQRAPVLINRAAAVVFPSVFNTGPALSSA